MEKSYSINNNNIRSLKINIKISKISIEIIEFSKYKELLEIDKVANSMLAMKLDFCTKMNRKLFVYLSSQLIDYIG